MLNGIKNNIFFQAGYIINGTKEEKDGFVHFMQDEIAGSYYPDTPLDTYEFNGSTVVLTGNDSENVKTSSQLPDYMNKNKLFDADNFYDKKNKSLLKGIVEFDPIFETYDKIISGIKKGLTTYFKRTYFDSVSTEDNYLPRLDFNRQVNILEALDIVDKLNGKAKSNSALSFHDEKAIGLYKQAIKNDEKLKELKVTGVAGAGMYSIVFNIDNDKVLKLSENPCYPKKFESFDLPAINKGYVTFQKSNISKDVVYYCILPKGKNSNEYRITTNEVCQVRDEIEKNGYETTGDILPSAFKQIVKLGDKPYLCDYDCAIHKSGESRLFKAPIEELVYPFHA
ncbi:MAG TPA: hypothetical protein DDW90_04960 [Cyanobacteria bacterium UBA9971]|nr:hypothetical protein [Cyanobacteria bacterium UBA9971]